MLQKILRWSVLGFGLIGVGLFVVATPERAEGQASFARDGGAGFVVSDIKFALADDAAQTGACPNGMTVGPVEQQRALTQSNPTAQAQQTQLNGFEGIARLFSAPNGQNLCLHPEAGAPDPQHRTALGANLTAYGMDLDGYDARANRTAAGTCAHNDLRGANGERGIDNQFFRAVGCLPSFQSNGPSNTFAVGMLTGSWGILITLSGVDDMRNDDDVVVGLYQNGDPIELSPTREPLADATYAIHRDQRYRATTRGRIRNGVLTTDPVDFTFFWDVNNVVLDRPLHAARLQMTIGADGSMEGYLGGYTPVEAVYDYVFGFRSGRTPGGDIAPERARTISASGYAATTGHSCHGMYYALHELADGDRDPATGRCNSISLQYRIRAIPAFVVDAATRSANDDLVQ